MDSQIFCAWQGTHVTAGATNGTTDSGSADVPEGTRISHGDPSPFGQCGDSERRSKTGRSGE